MKKIDILLLKSFAGPFFAAFFIGCFALVLQTLWVYVDEIVGRGVGLFVVAELIFYASIAVFIFAIPIGVLLASVMVLGNMGERYELSSFKSAGVPLLRVLKPLIFVSIGLACFSYLNSNFIFPVATLKMKSRLYDLKKTKPTLALTEKVFNDDFSDFTIYIGKKDADGNGIHDILIYDHRSISKLINLTKAKSGEIFLAKNDSFMIMKLYDGTQYQELARSRDNGAYPFMRSSFKEYTLSFPMEEFGMKSTNPELFRHHEFLNSAELLQAIDSIGHTIETKTVDFQLQHAQRITLFDERKNLLDSQLTVLRNKTTAQDEASISKDSTQVDSLREMDSLKTIRAVPEQVSDKTENRPSLHGFSAYENSNPRQVYQPNEAQKNVYGAGSKLFIKKQILDKPLTEYADLGETFEKSKQQRIYQVAGQYCSSILAGAKSTQFTLDKQERLKRTHIYQFHLQFVMSLICIVFLFIGGSMGALVRKGGFGYPIIISILFFVLFLMLKIFCEKNNKAGTADPVLLAWMPLLILGPLSYYLTVKAMNDSKVFDFDRINLWLKTKFKFLYGNKEATQATH